MRQRLFRLRSLAAVAIAGLFTGAMVSPLGAASASPETVVQTSVAADLVDASTVFAAPRDVSCDTFLGGTRIYCVHGTDGTVIVALENYAGCRTEDSCHWDYRANLSGPYAGDSFWMLVGSNP